MGARKAIEETIVDTDRDHWLGIPITGCEVCPQRAKRGSAPGDWLPP